jgi:hypothetical protein
MAGLIIFDQARVAEMIDAAIRDRIGHETLAALNEQDRAFDGLPQAFDISLLKIDGGKDVEPGSNFQL